MRWFAPVLFLALMNSGTAWAQSEFENDLGQWRLTRADGVMRLESPQGEGRLLELPSHWDDEDWQLVAYSTEQGKLTLLSRAEGPTESLLVAFFGSGDLSSDDIIWSGFSSPMSGSAHLYWDAAAAQLWLRAPSALLRACGEITQQLNSRYFDPSAMKFVAPPSATHTGALSGQPATGAGAVWTRPLHSILGFTPESGEPMAAIGHLNDGDLTTSLVFEQRALILVYPQLGLKADTLVLAGAAGTQGLLINEQGQGFQFEIDSTGQSLWQLEELGSGACFALEMQAGTELAELSLQGPFAKPQGIKALTKAALDEGAPYDRALAAALRIAIPEAKAALLEELEAATLTSDRARRALWLSHKAEPALKAEVAYLLARQMPSGELLDQALEILKPFPEAAAAALREQLKSLDTEAEGYPELAMHLATIPVSGSLNPLLRLLDRRAQQAQGLEPVLVALAATQARLCEPAATHLTAEEMRQETRVALMDALLLAQQQGPLPEGCIGDPNELASLVTAEDLAVRLRALALVEIFGGGEAIEAARGRLESAQVDIEMVYALRAIWRQGGEREWVIEALSSSWPTLRLQAARMLSEAADIQVGEAALAHLEGETWPEIRAELLSLAVAGEAPNAREAVLTILEDRDRALLERRVAAELLAQSLELPSWQALTVYFADESLPRSAKTSLFGAFLRRGQVDWDLVTDYVVAGLEPATKVDPWLRARTQSAIEAAVRAEAPEAEALILAVFDLIESDAPLYKFALTAAGYVDTPRLRSKLEALAARQGEVAAAAARALRRLDGDPEPFEIPQDVSQGVSF